MLLRGYRCEYIVPILKFSQSQMGIKIQVRWGFKNKLNISDFTTFFTFWVSISVCDKPDILEFTVLSK